MECVAKHLDAYAALSAPVQGPVDRIDTSEPPANKADQVRRQYLAVAHLAIALALVHEQLADSIALAPKLVDLRGQRSASIMETLGDILNAMDANDPDDDWLNPVFEVAHKMWPDAKGEYVRGVQDAAP